MLKIKSSSLFVFILLCFYATSYGQVISETKPLVEILKSIETKFEVRFTYATKNILDVKIKPPPKELSLSKSLAYLNHNTSFEFTKVDDRFITVVLKNDTKLYCGIIINSITNKVLDGATISISSSTYTTVTNSEGKFYIPSDIKNIIIKISYLGFEELQIHISSLKEKECVHLLMHPKIAKLDQVYISNYFTKGIEKQYNGSTTINTTNFGLLPGQIDNDVLQIIQVIPGVESIAEKVSNINIRGGVNDESLILWDDIKMYQNGHFFGLISAFNPDLTQKVTVFKNGTPSRFGEGVSGVIDMKSKNTVTNQFTGGGGFNLINANAFLELPLTKNLGIQVSGRRSLNDLVETSVYKSYADRIFQDTKISQQEFVGNTSEISSDEDFDFFDFSSKILWDFSSKDKLRVNFLTMENALDFTEKLEETAESKTSTLKQKNTVGGISWNHLWNNKLETTAFVYGSFYKLNSLNKDILTTQELKQENEVLETGIKIEANYIFSKKLSIQSGYHFSDVGISNTQIVNIPEINIHEKNTLQSHIIFGDFKYKTLNKMTTVNMGVRLNYYPKLSSFLAEPRISIHQKIGNGFSAELLSEVKNQTTSQRIDFQSDFLGVEKRRWVLANEEEFPIIKSNQISLGVMYNNYNWFINLEGFYKYVNGITTSSQGFQNQFQHIKSTGSYNVKGTEFTINKKIRAFSTWLSYAYTKNDYTFKSLTPSEFPNNIDVRHSVNLAGTYSYDKLKISVGFIWRTGKPFTTPVEGEEIISNGTENIIQYNSPNTERLPDYFRTNISAEYRWKLSNKIETKFNVAILNLWNRENILNTRYSIISDDNGESKANRIDEISLGLTPNFSIQLLF